MYFKGAFWSMMAGFAVGMIRFGLEFGYKVPPCGSLEEVNTKCTNLNTMIIDILCPINRSIKHGIASVS
mgnify:CR=1 FL=1